jgi:hypothetical protein
MTRPDMEIVHSSAAPQIAELLALAARAGTCPLPVAHRRPGGSTATRSRRCTRPARVGCRSRRSASSRSSGWIWTLRPWVRVVPRYRVPAADTRHRPARGTGPCRRGGGWTTSPGGDTPAAAAANRGCRPSWGSGRHGARARRCNGWSASRAARRRERLRREARASGRSSRSVSPTG